MPADCVAGVAAGSVVGASAVATTASSPGLGTLGLGAGVSRDGRWAPSPLPSAAVTVTTGALATLAAAAVAALESAATGRVVARAGLAGVGFAGIAAPMATADAL